MALNQNVLQKIGNDTHLNDIAESDGVRSGSRKRQIDDLGIKVKNSWPIFISGRALQRLFLMAGRVIYSPAMMDELCFRLPETESGFSLITCPFVNQSERKEYNGNKEPQRLATERP